MRLFRTIEAVAGGHYCVGDVITFTLHNGEEVEALAVKQEQDDTIFILVDCLRDEYFMNRTSSNRGGYKSCALRKALSSKIYRLFPDEIREKMVAFPTGDMQRLPTECEIFGCNTWGEDEPDDVKQWEPMKDRRSRIAFQGKNGGWEWYWLQNKAKGTAASFALANDGGITTCTNASNSGGVRPVFKI